MHRYAVRSRFVLHCLSVLASVVLLVLAGGCGESSTSRDSAAKSHAAKPSAAEIRAERARAENLSFVERVRPQVEAFCGDCHAMPRPASTARSEWAEEVNQGFVLYGESGRSDLEIPNYEDVLKFFEFQASEVVSFPDSILDLPPSPIPFRREDVRFGSSRPPGVTNVRWLDLGLQKGAALVYCDVNSGAVMAHWPGSDGGTTARLATLLQPVHTESCDLDADGWADLVVADIGEFNANDSDLGRVIWLRHIPETDDFETIELMEGIARVADVQPGDFDGDGDTDLLVGIFGWRETGSIVLLINQGVDEQGMPQFEEREIDPRHGASNVLPCDFNQDGKLDFIALLSQEHEVVELFLNQGDATFKNQRIWSAPDPAYGSSGIELVDLDLDGDLDVLYTNGDSFDRGPKPHHSVQWLENQGDLPFVHHHLCYMPGVLNARAGDFDGDGDLDVVAASLLSRPIREQFKDANTSSVVLLVQESPGVFTPTQLERSNQLHMSIATADFNGDGTLDFATGNYVRGAEVDQPDLVVYWNQ